jgi:sulfur carrier protein
MSQSILVNGEAVLLSENITTLSDLLAQKALLNRRIAVEYNHQVIKRQAYSEVVLQAGDVIEIVQAIGGG